MTAKPAVPEPKPFTFICFRCDNEFSSFTIRTLCPGCWIADYECTADIARRRRSREWAALMAARIHHATAPTQEANA